MMKQQNGILEESLITSGSDLHATTEIKDQENNGSTNYFSHPPPTQSQPLIKKKRSLPGNPGSKSLKSFFIIFI